MRTSKKVVWIISAIVGLIIVLLIFRAGMIVGYRQAEYSSEWQHFHNGSSSPAMSFGGVRTLWRDVSDRNGFLNDNGAIGVIVTVNPPTGVPSSIIVHDVHDNVNKTISLSSTTAIMIGSAGAPAATSSPLIFLRVGQNVVVIGTPNNQGGIDASIIHLLPTSPPSIRL